jgi:type II secretory pathway component PulF
MFMKQDMPIALCFLAILLPIAGLAILRFVSERSNTPHKILYSFLSLICYVITIGGVIGLIVMSTNNAQPAMFAVIIAIAAIAAAILRFASRRNATVSKTVFSFLSLICYAFIIGGITGLVFTAPSELFALTVSIAAITVAILIPASVVIGVAARPYHRSQQNALLWSMAIATEKSIPLIPTIDAFARRRTGRIASKARQLAQLLESGVPLPDAIEHVPGIFPPRVLPMIRVGYESGALAKALRQIVSSHDIFTFIMNSLISKLLYIALVIVFGSLMLTFMIIKIIPNYVKIFRDFGGHLPAITRALIGMSNFATQTWFIFLPIYLLFIGLIVYLIFSYLGWVSFYLPGMTRLLRRRHSAAILDSLSLAVENNQPLGNSMTSLAATYPQLDIRQKLCYVCVEIQRGADWCESLCRHGLIKQADQAVLSAAKRVGNLPWAMREMADSNRRRLAYRLNALVQLAYPPVILCLGLLVMFVVVALFYPLITLIMRLV